MFFLCFFLFVFLCIFMYFSVQWNTLFVEKIIELFYNSRKIFHTKCWFTCMLRNFKLNIKYKLFTCLNIQCDTKQQEKKQWKEGALDLSQKLSVNFSLYWLYNNQVKLYHVFKRFANTQSITLKNKKTNCIKNALLLPLFSHSVSNNTI